MGKIIVITFAFLAFAFYELSDGNEFVPIADEKRAALQIERIEKERLLAEAKAEKLRNQPKAEPVEQVVLASAIVSTEQPQTQQDEVLEAVTAALDADKAEDIVADAVVEDVAAPQDIREVTAARVNMRNGPGQNFSVVAKLTSGEQVEILQDPGDGWVKLRVAENGRVGWMADFLLTASNN
ncbi:SH3 domain-containing protein [Planktotalea sp.]|uniref:SH3 domain-containing protein n=1 Tax=Planktotalea sp. TaxID=2029877 RepID=UPI003D6C2B0B